MKCPKEQSERYNYSISLMNRQKVTVSIKLCFIHHTETFVEHDHPIDRMFKNLCRQTKVELYTLVIPYCIDTVFELISVTV